MQFELPLLLRPQPGGDAWLRVGTRRVPIRFVVNRRARRYILRLSRDGSPRVTVPRGGNMGEALRFAERNSTWLERQLICHASRPRPDRRWVVGTGILLDGESLQLRLAGNGEPNFIQLGAHSIRVADPTGDLRREVEHYLRLLASRLLPRRVLELATRHGFVVNRVNVRDQRSRWGSCSRRGTISLNWRLVQAPGSVRDYLILHELAHLRHMNHSDRFWQEVGKLCPDFEVAEFWLKQHAKLLSQ
jgi:predicted metal-dependent hydrolase